MRGEGKFDGVFGIWYGKGPGVDRAGDALRHANHAGTSKHGGVIAIAGDDHTCESSTTAHQSEPALIDAMIPVLHPAGVQEILDYGLHGFAMSRYAGVWVGAEVRQGQLRIDLGGRWPGRPGDLPAAGRFRAAGRAASASVSPIRRWRGKSGCTGSRRTRRSPTPAPTGSTG